MDQFLMSFRFNKTIPSDFGLTGPNDEGLFVRLSDGSIWQSRKLYDYGWGQENGFVRLPTLDFKSLVEIALNSRDQEDRFGAAEILKEDHPDVLLQYCEDIFTAGDASNIDNHRAFFKMLKLDLAYNLTFAPNQSPLEVENQHARWKVIATLVTKGRNGKGPK